MVAQLDQDALAFDVVAGDVQGIGKTGRSIPIDLQMGDPLDQGILEAISESPDALFSRARGGEFDWVLALYHDQGLIAVKTVAFGSAVNWTLGLPFIRTSVDHGTAFAIAGSGQADAEPLARAVDGALKLASGELPRGRRDGG